MSAIDLPVYIPIPDAARKYAVPAEALARLVGEGRVRAVRVNGEVLVLDAVDNNRELRRNGADQGAELAMLRVQFAHLEGVPIRLIDAVKRYKILDSNLVRWSHAGHIRVLERGPKLLLLDEADVAVAAALYRQRGGPRQGKEVFPRKKRAPNHAIKTTG